MVTLALAGHSYSEIVAAVGCSRREIAAVKMTITAYGITAGQAASMNPAEIAGTFFDGRKRVSEDYAKPDFDQVLASIIVPHRVV
ncbi:hypothetical protein GCM10009831_04140 [Dietzia cercidiphylli]|uniref:Transposase n=1 Tax=Dietzia cercidiphylli TaxID=498199 RepID=A0ABN2I5P0_9ACTN